MAMLFCALILAIFYACGIDSYASTVTTSEGFKGAVDEFLNEYKSIIGIAIAFSLITNIGIFIYHFMSLGASSTNPQKRARAIHNLMITGLTTALFGAVPLIFSILYSTFWMF